MSSRVSKAAKPPRVPSYCQHRASGQAYVKVNGRVTYLGVYGSDSSRTAYAAAVSDVLAGRPVSGPQRADIGIAQGLTVREVCDRYSWFAEGYYRKNGQPTTELGIVAIACRRASDQVGDLPAESFGPLALKSFRDRLVEEGLARTTINGLVSRLRRAFKWAASEELVSATIPQALATVSGLQAGRTTARETAPVLPVADDVVEATLAKLPAVVADMVRLQRLAGMRPGEVCDLRPRDLDRTAEVWTYRPASHKTQHHSRERVVFLGPKAQDVLLRYLARDPSAHCFRPCDSEAKRRAEAHAERVTPLSCGERPGERRIGSPLRAPGTRYGKDAYARAIARAAKKAGVEHWTPNQLRHACATTVRRDHGLEAAQVILGHSTARTSEIYAEKNLAAGAAVAKAIG